MIGLSNVVMLLCALCGLLLATALAPLARGRPFDALQQTTNLNVILVLGLVFLGAGLMRPTMVAGLALTLLYLYTRRGFALFVSTSAGGIPA